MSKPKSGEILARIYGGFRQPSTALKDAKRVGNHTLARFTGEYDMFGNQTYSKGQILFDSVRRFKGQQAAAVVLTDVDPREKQLAQELQILFCGLTRATVRLEIVCNAGNPRIQERILQHGPVSTKLS